MNSDGYSFYDDEAIFQTYMQHRYRSENPNDTLEKPALLELLGDVRGKRILDLGCGDASFGVELLQMGCQSYTGIEASQKMVEAARQTLAGTPAQVVQTTMEAWQYPPAAFDLAVSRLALQYVEDLPRVLRQVRPALAAGGRLVFSVEHPVITSGNRPWEGLSLHDEWILDHYFNTGLRVVSWLGGQVLQYHRTVEDYFRALQDAGFRVEGLREGRPRRSSFRDEETYRRRERVPLFLLLAARTDSLEA